MFLFVQIIEKRLLKRDSMTKTKAVSVAQSSMLIAMTPPLHLYSPHKR